MIVSPTRFFTLGSKLWTTQKCTITLAVFEADSCLLQTRKILFAAYFVTIHHFQTLILQGIGRPNGPTRILVSIPLRFQSWCLVQFLRFYYSYTLAYVKYLTAELIGYRFYQPERHRPHSSSLSGDVPSTITSPANSRPSSYSRI